jgi:superkiller protein 3
VCAVLLVALVPSAAAAQQAHFVQALSELTAAIAGTYGDEGTLVRPAIDRMSAALAAWDREIAAAAAGVPASLDNPAPGLVDRRVSLGRMYADRGRLDNALSEFDTASRLDPRRADIHALRGLVFEAAGRSSDALEAFRTARMLEPGNPVYAYYLFHAAAIHKSAKDAREAASALAAAYSELMKRPARQKNAPFTHIALLQPSDRAPLVPLAAYSQAYRHIVRGEYDRAIVEFRNAAQDDPLVADPAAGSAPLLRAVGAFRQGRLSEARSLLSQPGPPAKSSEAHRLLGFVYWAESDYEKSVAELTEALRQSPKNERARLALSRVLTTANRDADAERVLRETLAVLPESALAHWWLGSNYERLNRFAEARQEFEQAAAAAVAGESQLLGAVGRLASAAADVAGAVDAFARAVTAHPNDAALHKSLAGALVQQERPEEAVAEFVAALLIDPGDAEAHLGIGQIHLDAGRLVEAVDALGRATDISPRNTDARYALASALVRLGRPDEAAQHFARVEREQRQLLADQRRSLSHDVLKEEGALRAAEGKPDAAIALYEKALTVTPDPAVYGLLADLYAKVGRTEDAARARAIYQKASQNGRVDGSAR